jgi:hypothetical protein
MGKEQGKAVLISPGSDGSTQVRLRVYGAGSNSQHMWMFAVCGWVGICIVGVGVSSSLCVERCRRGGEGV